MDIEVKLYSPLNQERFSKGTVSLKTPGTVDSLLQLLAIKQHEVGGVFVNSQSTTFNHSLNSGDKVTLLPLIGGG